MKRIFFLFVLLFSMSTMVLGQDLTAELKNDPNVKIGKLPNGMTYYIRENKKPEGRVEMRLAVRAGSMQENEDQLGLAHFTEHMAFNGIEGYPGNTMISELQKIGVSFGREINAYTSFDETVYELTIPVEHLNMGINILKGWANGLLFDGKEIDAERGIISEEYRMGLGADDRMRKKWFPVALTNSRYANRMPIGTLEVIQNHKYETIRQFYRDWYRPDLQAVVIVGDIKTADIEPLIIETFGKIPAKENPREKIMYPIANNKDPLVVVCSDPEASGNIAMIFRKHPHFTIKTLGDFKKQLAIELSSMMYSSRFSEMQQKANVPFIQAGAGYGNLIGECDAYQGQIVAKENRILEAFTILLQEDYRVRNHGFLQTELDRAKEALLNMYERESKEVDKTESYRFASQYVQHFVSKQPIPGAKREYNYAKKYIDEITLDEINEMVKSWITKENLVAVVTMPEKEGVIIPTEQQLLDIINDASLENVAPYVDTYKDRELVDPDKINAGTIISKRDIPEVGAQELTLSNGIKVITKHTDFKNDEVLFAAQSKGGMSLYYECDLASGLFATDLVDRAGIGELDFSSLEKKMQSKKAGVVPYISQISEGFQGSFAPKDAEFFFQYLYSFFTQPRYDTAVYALVMGETQEQLKMIKAQPMYKFIGELLSTSTQNDPYYVNQLTMSDEFLAQVDYERAFQIYQQRFANPADFTYYFVGNFDEATLHQHIEKYLGSLSCTNEKEDFKADVFKGFPKGIVENDIYVGTEEQSWVGIMFSEEFEWNAKNRMIINQISEALSIELIETIREKMSGVYSPMLDMGYSKYPETSFETMVMFSCSPKNTDKLAKAVFKILQNFQKKGPKEETFAKVKQQMIKKRETDLETNSFWLNHISNKIFYGENFKNLDSYANEVNSITIQDIIEFAQKYIHLDHYTRVDMYPEKMAPKK